MVQIPIDICGIICQDPSLRPEDLLALATVSRSFHGEAERQLYSDVSIVDPRFIKGWCLTIARKAYLSPRVKSLKIVFPPSKDLEAADHSRITKSLRACVNLQTLGVRNDGRTPPGDSIQTWIIENHPFKLLHFINDYFQSTYLNTFYAQHPGIRTLSSPIFHILYKTPTVLPNLTTLDAPANFLEHAIGPGWDNHKHLRNIQYSLHDDSDEMAFIQALGKFKATLTSVSINRKTHIRWGFRDVIARVVSAAPGVKFLRITDEWPTALIYAHPQPVDIVSDHLIAVVIKVIMPKSFQNADPPHETRLNFGIFDTLFPMARSLEHVTVIMGKNYCYSREVDGRLVYMGEVDVDDSERWMTG